MYLATVSLNTVGYGLFILYLLQNVKSRCFRLYLVLRLWHFSLRFLLLDIWKLSVKIWMPKERDDTNDSSIRSINYDLSYAVLYCHRLAWCGMLLICLWSVYVSNKIPIFYLS